MAQQTGSAPAQDRSPGRVDLVSVLYVVGGIPSIIAFLFLLFAVGVRFCGLPA
ncbi:MAG: hypothetical protein OZ948_01520 [Deltaproteobacteria bacterium]|nr:hypothetical protein [Deltaproteobacteria bacterium]